MYVYQYINVYVTISNSLDYALALVKVTVGHSAVCVALCIYKEN